MKPSQKPPSSSQSSLKRALEAEGGVPTAITANSFSSLLQPSQQHRHGRRRQTLEDAQNYDCILAIVGSVDFYHEDTPALCDAIGLELASAKISSEDEDFRICLWTGANADIPKRLAQTYHETCIQLQQPSHIYHLAPSDYDCDWDFGQVVTAGWDMSERRKLLTTLATVVLSIEGGPGTADEMALALGSGVPVVPLIRTGGASSGMFEAPTVIPPPNHHVSHEDWKLLANQEASVQTCAQAVVRIIHQICKNRKACLAE